MDKQKWSFLLFAHLFPFVEKAFWKKKSKKWRDIKVTAYQKYVIKLLNLKFRVKKGSQ